MVLRGSSGKTYKLQSTPFAGGGEGDIYNVNGYPGYVAKLYKKGNDMEERERKLKVMLQRKPQEIGQYAWPIDILYDNGKFVGFVMPKVSGKKKLSDICSYEERRNRSWKFYITVAKNLAAAINNVHEIDHVIGDLNPKNVMVDPNSGLVVLVDTDSYHISDGSKIYRCKVGQDVYVPSELQGVHFPSAKLPTFTKETDRFSLAVLIFETLMNGVHPFSCRVSGGSSSSFQPVSNIKNCYCPFFPESRPANMEIPFLAPDMNGLPPMLRNLFFQAFVQGHKKPSARPAAEQWHRMLEQLPPNLKPCSKNRNHEYYQGIAKCPWCEVEDRWNATAKAMNAGTVKTGNAGKTTTQTNRTTAQGTNTYFTPPPPPPPPPPPRPLWERILMEIMYWIAEIAEFLLEALAVLFELIALFWGQLLGIAFVIVLIVLFVRGCGKEKEPIDPDLLPQYEEQTEGADDWENYEDGESDGGEQTGNDPAGDISNLILPGKSRKTILTGQEVENNNTRGDANAILVGKEYTGSLSAKRDKEQDWYVFILEEPGTVSLNIQTKKQSSWSNYKPYWDFTVYRENGYDGLIWEVVNWNENDIDTKPKDLNAGVYYLAVQSVRQRFSKDPYRFTVNFEPKPGCEIEPNDSLETATLIRVNQPVRGELAENYGYGSCDYFVFSAPAEGAFRVRFDTPLQESDSDYWEINLFSAKDTDEELLDYDTVYGDATETLTPYIGVNAGDTYYFRVGQGWNRGKGQYTVTVEFEERDDWEKERNETPETATRIDLDRACHGALTGRYGSEQDWYAFTVPEEMTVQLSFAPDEWNELGLECWDVSVRDAGDPNRDLWRENVSGDVESEELSLSPGTYFVKVESTSHWSGIPYSVTVHTK